MRSLLLVLAACGATVAQAGGLDQSGQPVTLLFAPGDYAEIVLGYVMPRIDGVDPGGTNSGNVYNDLGWFGLGVKRQLSADWSAAVIVDQPYGVVVNYDLAFPGGAFPFAGTHAEPSSLGVTGLLRYRVDPRFSLHAGLRAERFGGEATLAGAGYRELAGYSWTGDPDWGLGYVLGAAYERPEIALRIALTYGSEIRHALDADENFFGASTTEVTMPQSVNLDFETGVAAKTLVYGLVRWVNWDGWEVAPRGLLAATGLPLIAFDQNSFTYRLGLGRAVTDAFVAAIEVSHETAKDRSTTPLDPYDGYTGVGLGGRYTLPSGVSIGGGLAYNRLGDAEVRLPNGAAASFRGNSAIAARLSLGMAF